MLCGLRSTAVTSPGTSITGSILFQAEGLNTDVLDPVFSPIPVLTAHAEQMESGGMPWQRNRRAIIHARNLRSDEKRSTCLAAVTLMD
jgi:hypothetical protein